MILQALVSYYDRLAEQQDMLPPYGWSWEKISYCVVLRQDGSIQDVQDIRMTHQVKNKTVYSPRPLMVPVYPEGRTSGVKANYLWDNSAYTLGLSEKPKDLDKKYQDFWDKVASFDAARSNALQAMRKFPAFWQAHKQDYDYLKTKDFLDSNIVFRVVTEGNRFVHDCPEFKAQWNNALDAYLNGLSDGQCLVGGNTGKIAELHNPIKGIDNAQTSGAYIVSFNKDAFESYGLKRGKNASVGAKSAFKYATALNHLLRKESDNKQRLKIGDAMTVFWAEANENAHAERAEAFMAEALSPTDQQETASLASVLQQIAQGIPLKELRPDLDPATKFFILGLSPNAARLSIRFWYATTLDELTRRIGQHYHDLRMEPQQGNGLPEIWWLTYATAPVYLDNGKHKTDADRISPLLAGNLARAIFTGQAYPQSLLSQVLIRMRTDGTVTHTRVSLCKAVINRQIRLNQSNTRELPMSLDVNEKNVAYRMGRLFAVLESIQKQALGNDINATIRDRYWGAASATPALVFPSLMRNAMNHLAKIRKDDVEKRYLASFFDGQIKEIQDGMPSYWPRNLNLQEQGRFAIGYYQQRHTRKIKDQTGKEVENLVAVHDESDQTED
ncbi:type I-C CRISPR-associated protein Cas8c/Csd1 [Methylomonas sp. MgM2]